MFTRAEMNSHVKKSGKTIGNQDHHSVPTGLRKAKTFLEDEYLHEIEATCDQRHFYFRAKCCHSFRKNDAPHTLKIALCVITGAVNSACCSCVAGKVGFCNHILALMLKMCKFTLYDCQSTKDLCQDEDQNPAMACTSELQKWHNKGGGKNIVSQPVMEVNVNKTRLDEARVRPGVRCLLYEARVNNTHDKGKAQLLMNTLKNISPNMGLAQMANDHVDENLVETKFGKCQVGSLLSYQVGFTESNFTAVADIDTVPRVQGGNCQPMQYPRFPLRNELEMEVPDQLTDIQKKVVAKLTVDENKINEVETATQQQAKCDKWKDERSHRFTASRFHMIRKRKRNHDTFAQTLMHPKPFTSKYVEHGRRYEPVALLEYEKFMRNRKTPVQVLPSGLVISRSHPFIGATPDAKVIDTGCTDYFGLVEVKCPQTKYNVTPVEACSDPNFFMEKNGDTNCKLKENNAYYAQVQGQMGVTGARWCDFVVYTNKGLFVQRIPFDIQFWEQLRGELTRYFFDTFLQFAATDLFGDN